MAAGAAMPPTAARIGMAASRGLASGPPGSVASYTSFVTSPKKNTIATSLTTKWIARVKRL